MATVALRRTAVQAMTVRQRRLARWVLSQIGLVEPAPYLAPGGNVWLVFDDHRISLHDVAYLGCFAANLANIPAGYTPPDDLSDATASEIRAWIRAYLVQHVVWPVSVPEGADPWQAVLDAQGAPAAVRAGNGVPDTWTPVA